MFSYFYITILIIIHKIFKSVCRSIIGDKMKYLSKYLSIFFMIIALFIIGCSLDNSANTQKDVAINSVNGNVQSSATTAILDTNTISLSELKKHSTESDCWVAFEGAVYDITDYLPMHPGGVDKISVNCGTSSQFESAFMQKHGTSKVIVLESKGLYKGKFVN
jgi:hypothetical protein